MTSTCQICARAIKSKNGLIAHHGYTRPGYGYQTRSCPGAKFRPYEVSCDCIQATIDSMNSWVEKAQATHAEWIANPPDTLTWAEMRNGRTTGRTITVARPVGFDTGKPRGSFSLRDEDRYASHFWSTQSQRKRDIAGTKETIWFLGERLAAWVAPAA